LFRINTHPFLMTTFFVGLTLLLRFMSSHDLSETGLGRFVVCMFEFHYFFGFAGWCNPWALASIRNQTLPNPVWRSPPPERPCELSLSWIGAHPCPLLVGLPLGGC
jgi:hypothetical protein